jgi:hypothetical protein
VTLDAPALALVQALNKLAVLAQKAVALDLHDGGQLALFHR